MQPNRLLVRIESSAFSSTIVEIRELDGREAMGELFELQVHVIAEHAGLDDEAVLSNPAVLVFERGDVAVRRMHGIIVAIRNAMVPQANHTAYTLTFVPRAYIMTLTKTSQVFLDVSVPEILRAKLVATGFEEDHDFQLRLRAAYPKREFVMQYQETDWAFCTRLAEHLGITLFFEHTAERDVLVFSDDNAGSRPVGTHGRAPFYPRGDRTGVYELESTTRIVPGVVVRKDYNYRKFQLELRSSAPVANGGAGEIAEYGDNYKTPDEGSRAAQVRAEEIGATRLTYSGESDLQIFAAGARCTVEGHPRGDKELLLTEVRHRALQTTFGTSDTGDRSYWNEFRAISAATPFRPHRATPKPRVYGVIHARVEVTQPSPYAEVDTAGRYHVRFMFDSTDSAPTKASHLVRMAQPHAGPGYGFHFPLRDGVEVLIAFIDGDPDRPIITSAVPNPQTPSTVVAQNHMRNVVRTGAGNELNISDERYKNRIKLTTPYASTAVQMGAPEDPEAGLFARTDAHDTRTIGMTLNSLSAASNDLAGDRREIARESVFSVAGALFHGHAELGKPAHHRKWVPFAKEALRVYKLIGGAAGARRSDVLAKKVAANTQLRDGAKKTAVASIVDKSPQKAGESEAAYHERLLDEAKTREQQRKATEANALRSGKAKTALSPEKKKELAAHKRLDRAERRLDQAHKLVAKHAQRMALSPSPPARAALVDQLGKALEASDSPEWHDIVRAITLFVTEQQRLRLAQAVSHADETLDQSHLRAPVSIHEAATDNPEVEGFNVVSATRTAALLGQTAVVSGEKSVTVSSEGFVNVAAGTRGFVSAASTLEIAAPSRVEIMSRHKVAIGGETQVAVIACAREEDADTGTEAIPAEHSMLIRSNESVLVDTVAGCVHVTAMAVAPGNDPGDVTVTAKANVLVSAKENAVGIKAEEDSVTIEAKKAVRITSDNDDITMTANNEVNITASTSDMVLTSKTRVALVSQDRIEIGGANTGVKLRGKNLVDIGSDSGNVTVSGTNITLSGKVMLG
jgi:type VI secretion system VgrG family protein